jgi:alpha-beta hydrolase superfamily lysophospholipase
MVSHAEEHLVKPDGSSLFVQAWIPDRPRGALLIVHGLGEHSGRHAGLARFFADKDLACYAFDCRGHGRSSGRRGHIGRFAEYSQDVLSLDALVAERISGPRFLVGHSYGGLVVLDVLLSENPPKVRGAVLSSPLLGIPPAARPAAPLAALARGLSRAWPTVPFPNGINPRHLSRDPSVVAGYLADPLVGHSVSPRWYVETMKALESVHLRAGELRVPLLLLYAGADRIVDPEATHAWATLAPRNLVEEVRYPGLFHEIFREPEAEAVLGRMSSWLDRQLLA